jgi:acetolactate synthase-1/2/3 large subunit
VQRAVEVLWSAKRPLVITGRGARARGPRWCACSSALNALYLDTGESRGLVPDDHPSVVGGDARLGDGRGRRRRHDRPQARLPARLRLAGGVRRGAIRAHRRRRGELRDNRRGAVELSRRPPSARLRSSLPPARAFRRPTPTGRARARKHAERARSSSLDEDAPPGRTAACIPNRLLAALARGAAADAIVVADGGDFLSFARVGLPAATYLDPGPLGCIGVGTPFGIAASLAFPGRTVVVATGDGAFGFNAMEIDTAVRHRAPILVVVANNGSWAIEVRDQQETHGKVVGTRLQFADHAAMARAFGCHGERVESAEALPGAIARAMANRPALLDVVVTPDAPSSDAKSGLAWVPDLQALAAWDEAERTWRAS